MRYKGLLLLILFYFICTSSPLFAQFSISGKVLNDQGKPFEKASVSLLSLPDSSLFMQTSTNESGQYDFQNNTHGSFVLRISAVGYETQWTRSYATSAGDRITATPIILKATSIAIETVHMYGKPPAIQQFVDKMVVQVEETVLAEGNSVLELLEKTPGIVSDGKGNFSIQGRTGANIKINGRDVYISGTQLANMLRGLQARDVAKMELISSPSSKEDAAGTAGIINIITKKNKRSGFGGDLFVRGSHTRKKQGSAGGGLHYKTDRINFFTNVSTGYEEEKAHSRLSRSWTNEQGQLVSKQTQTEKTRLNPGRYHSIHSGITVDFDTTKTLEASFNWVKGKFISYTDIDIDFLNGQNQLLERAATRNNFDEGYNNLTFNVNYTKKYNSDNHYLKLNVDYAPHTNKYDNAFYTDYLETTTTRPTSARHNIQDLSNTTYSARLDYSRPIGEHSLYEIGWKGSHFYIDNKRSNDTLQNNNWIKDGTSSNNFQYTQHVEAAYLTFTSKIQRFEYKLGLRSEYTYTKANQKTNAATKENNYIHFFPTAFVSYNLTEQHALRGSFSSRIERPNDHDVNAFRVYEDAFTYYEGNPDLKPERSNILELGHSFKNKLFTTLGLSHSRDVRTWITGTGDLPNQTFSRPENIGKHKNYSASIMYNNSFTPFWTGSHYINGFHNKYTGTVNDIDLDTKGSSWTANSRHTLTLAKDWRIEALGYYKSPVVNGVRKTAEAYGLDIAIEKKLLSERAMIKLAANGLIRNAKPSFSSTFNNLYIESQNFPDNRKVLLSFHYRFGN